MEVLRGGTRTLVCLKGFTEGKAGFAGEDNGQSLHMKTHSSLHIRPGWTLASPPGCVLFFFFSQAFRDPFSSSHMLVSDRMTYTPGWLPTHYVI